MTVGAVQSDAATAEFLAGTARGELLLRHCAACGAFSRPQAQSCEQCQSADLTWARACGQGTVVSWSVVHGRAAGGGPPPRTVVAIVELDEGPWLHAQLADAEPGTLSGDPASPDPAGPDPGSPDPGSPRPADGGLRVTASFERAPGGEAIPVFRPA
jgi:uncharacterized OB-fold protein